MNILTWTIDVASTEINPMRTNILHGEDCALEVSVNSLGQPLDLTGATVNMYWQSGDMLNTEWYSAEATIGGDNNNIVYADWSHLFDTGKSKYVMFFRIALNDVITYRAYAVVNMLVSPNFVPNEVALPLRTIDFAEVEILNSPYALDDDLDLHIVDFDNPHGVTAAQAGAMAIADGAALANRVTEVEGNVDSLEVINAKIAQYGTSDITITNPLAFGFDGAGTITDYDFDLGGAEVVIPCEINGIPVTAIGEYAFSDAYTWMGDPITSVIAPKSITTIANSALNGCQSLASVSFPSVMSIAEFAFMGCSRLASVSLQSATTIGNSAFIGCINLASVSFPLSTSIGGNAFLSCGNLTSVSFPSVTSIGSGAFSSCSSLTSVFYGGDKPISPAYIYESAPNVTSYVLSGTTGWGSTFPESGDYQRPVVMVDDFDYVTKTMFANSVKAKSVIVDGVNVVDSLAAKADNVTVTALAATVATKADNSTVCDLATTVAAKADSSTVTTLSTTVATKADKTLAYTTLTGTAVTVSPNASYTWTATGTCTISAYNFATGYDASCSIIITMGADATISGTNVILVDDIAEGVNHCFIRSMPDGTVKLFVSYLED